MPTRNQIIKIHALKGSLKLDDETYRAILGGYGVKSSTKLTIVKADQLIDDLTQKATAAGVWEQRPGKKAGGASAGGASAGGARAGGARAGGASPAPTIRKLADDYQSRMIRGIWIELHEMGAVRDSSEKAIASYVKRMTNVAALQWLDVKQAQTVIEALKKWRKRVNDAKQ